MVCLLGGKFSRRKLMLASQFGLSTCLFSMALYFLLSELNMANGIRFVQFIFHFYELSCFISGGFLFLSLFYTSSSSTLVSPVMSGSSLLKYSQMKSEMKLFLLPSLSALFSGSLSLSSSMPCLKHLVVSIYSCFMASPLYFSQ